MKIIKITLLLLFINITLLLSQDLDELLSTYTHNSDLSKTTKLENGGTVTVFTRKDLEIMQVRNLKDLLKSFPVLRYKESRFGIPDILNKGKNTAFNSSNIRIYIDNQELTSSTFGSGLAAIGNMEMGFIDHVEIYSQAPSYEFSTEPTYILIKLYSKVAQRDRGGKVELSSGSRGFNRENLFYAQESKKFSYVASLQRLDDKKKNYKSHDIPINRDYEDYTFFASLYNKNHKLNLFAKSVDYGLSIAGSPRATYETSEAYYNVFQIAYETEYFTNALFSIVYQQADIKGEEKETEGFESISPLIPNAIEYDRSEHSLTSEYKYTLENKNHRLITGAKFRHKYFKTNELKINSFVVPASKYNDQDIFTVFAEERYSISDYNIINMAAQYARVINNADIDDQNLIQLRIGHTYNYNNLIFNSFIYHTESLAEPYLYTDYQTLGSLKPQIQNSFSEEIKYTYNKSQFDFVISYKKIEDAFVQTPMGDFINNPQKSEGIMGYLEYTYSFNNDNKIIANASNRSMRNSPYEETASFVRSLNRYGRFDIFNEIIYNYNSTTRTNYYDYSAGIKYRHNKDLTLSIKGENIFGTGYEDSYSRVDPNTGIYEEHILISPIEQRFYISIEYMFL